MKKLLILFLIISSTSILGQTKQNDATWEETISFIKRYSRYKISGLFDYRRGFSIDKGYIIILKGGNEWINKRGKYGNSPYKKVEIDNTSSLKKLYGAKLNGDKILLQFSTNSVIVKEKTFYMTDEGNGQYWKQTQSRSYDQNYLTLQISDLELRPRMLKAFKHLSYLATKERAKIRKKYYKEKF